MAYFGRSLKKPQQHGKSTGGRTKSGFERSATGEVRQRAVSAVRRALKDPRPERGGRQLRAARAERSTR
jgi:hypothetical protein